MVTHQATVLYYRTTESKPSDRSLVDLRINENENLSEFKTRLITNECFGERCQFSIGKFTVRVGYCERVTVKSGMPPSLGVFGESLTDEQFHHCLFKLENVSPKYVFSSVHKISIPGEAGYTAFFSL